MHVVGVKSVIERALVSYSGVTTANGNVGGTTLIDTNLTVNLNGQNVIIASGTYVGQSRDIDGDTSGGTITVSTAFGAQIVSGTVFHILTGLPAMAELAAIQGTGFDTTTESLVVLHDDHITLLTALRLAELDAANLPADIDTLLARLTAARAGYLDELAAANIPADVDTLLTRLTALRAGYLDNINQAGLLQVTAARAALLDQITALRMAELDAANLPADIDTLLARLTAARAGYLDELAAANIPADIDTLLARLTALRAGYLDNLSGGAVALAASWTAALATALGNYTAARAGYLDELAAANIPADVDTLLARLTALRAGYLDNLSGGAVALAANYTAARALLLDQITALRMAELDAANMPADLDTIKGYLDTEIAAILADTGTDGVVVNSRTAAYGRLVGVPQVIEVSITSAANAGNVTVATITTQPCVIDSVVIHADTAQTANMTTCAVYGGAGSVVTFISTTDATQANLNAIDKQVSWTGAVRLAATKTIVIDLLGTGAAAVDLTITISYHAAVAGGYLA